MEQPITKKQLPNGLLVMLKEIHTAPIISHWVWYRVGSRNEIPGCTGISHWVEHMQFKGTPQFPASVLDKAISREGGFWNAFTYLDWTTYFETMPSEKIDLALRLEADRMMNTEYTNDEVASERTVIISERQGNENQPLFRLGEELQAMAFRVHSYHHEVIGDLADLQSMQREDLDKHYRMYYTPNNAVLAVAGDFKTDEMLHRIEELFASIPAGVAPPTPSRQEPPQSGERRVTMEGPGETTFIQFAHHAPAGTDRDFFALTVLDSLLTGPSSLNMFGGGISNKTSRLYQALVDGELAVSVSGGLQATIDPFLHTITVVLRPERVHDEVLAVLNDEIKRLQDAPPQIEELNRAVKQARALFAYGSEFDHQPGVLARVLRDVRQLRLVRYLSGPACSCHASRCATRSSDLFAPAKPHLWGLLTLREWRGDMMRQPGTPMIHSLPGPDDITRVVLPNGIVVLARANFNSPSVALTGYLPAGSLSDPDDKLGLADFAASGLMRGTAHRDFQAIYDALESAGASLGFDGGTHTTGFGGRALAEDLSMLLELISQALRQPVFPENQVERLRAQVLTGLAIRAQDTGEMASLAFDKIVYAGHPYSRPDEGVPETVQSITRQDLLDFHQRYFSPREMVVVVVGAVEPSRAVDLVAAVLADWGNPQQVDLPDLPHLKPLQATSTEVVSIPGKYQSDIVMGVAGPPRRSPDFVAASLGNSVLGQFGMMGRIGDAVREKAGLAYYAYSSLSGGMGPGPWSISAGVDPANVEQAQALIRQEIARFVSQPVDAAELADSQANFIGRLPLSLESNSGVAGALLNLERYDLGLDYYFRYADMVRAVTVEDVLAAAQHYLHPDKLGIAIAGPPAS